MNDSLSESVHSSAKNPLRTLQRRLGFKDRLLFRCRGGRHVWRKAYGDERMYYGMWHCTNCPYGRSGPSEETTPS
jgi:hypothetical protein